MICTAEKEILLVAFETTVWILTEPLKTSYGMHWYFNIEFPDQKFLSISHEKFRKNQTIATKDLWHLPKKIPYCNLLKYHRQLIGYFFFCQQFISSVSELSEISLNFINYLLCSFLDAIHSNCDDSFYHFFILESLDKVTVTLSSSNHLKL